MADFIEPQQPARVIAASEPWGCNPLPILSDASAMPRAECFQSNRCVAASLTFGLVRRVSVKHRR
jgi:hypothetical protein